jgi:hypothetical protein
MTSRSSTPTGISSPRRRDQGPRPLLRGRFLRRNGKAHGRSPLDRRPGDRRPGQGASVRGEGPASRRRRLIGNRLRSQANGFSQPTSVKRAKSCRWCRRSSRAGGERPELCVGKQMPRTSCRKLAEQLRVLGTGLRNPGRRGKPVSPIDERRARSFAARRSVTDYWHYSTN